MGIGALALLGASLAMAPSPSRFLVLGAALLGVGAGVSVLRQAGARLREAERRVEALDRELHNQRMALDSFADGIDVAVFLCDSEGKVLFANRKATELFNFRAPIGQTLLEVTLSAELADLVAECVRVGDQRSAEIAFRHPCQRIGQARAWRDSTTDMIFVTVYDITDLRRLERVRQDFVANVSHELRTPMSAIRAMAETLQEDDDEKLRVRYLARIIAEVDRLNAIADDLLTLTHAETGRVERRPVDLVEVARDVVVELEPRAKEKGIELTFDVPPALIVEGNAEQLHQVLRNLIENGIKYTDAGRVHLLLTPDGSRCLVEVSDTGIGIPLEHQERVWERFYRVDKGRSRQSGGTGLGLSIVKHIVEAHGGQVGLESELNKGSTFRVWLPLARS